MKKILLSTAAVFAMSSMAFAGGDIQPVEPVVEVPAVAEVSDSGFYIGGAYGYNTVDFGISGMGYSESDDASYNAFMFQAGYKFNPYVAVEARYWWGDSETLNYAVGDVKVDLDSWGIYVKPMYPVTGEFNVYGLLGYANTDQGNALSTDADGFSWGLGASYDVTKNVSVFVDYVSLYDDDQNYAATYNADLKVDSWNFGVSYKF